MHFFVILNNEMLRKGFSILFKKKETTERDNYSVYELFFKDRDREMLRRCLKVNHVV